MRRRLLEELDKFTRPDSPETPGSGFLGDILMYNYDLNDYKWADSNRYRYELEDYKDKDYLPVGICAEGDGAGGHGDYYGYSSVMGLRKLSGFYSDRNDDILNSKSLIETFYDISSGECRDSSGYLDIKGDGTEFIGVPSDWNEGPGAIYCIDGGYGEYFRQLSSYQSEMENTDIIRFTTSPYARQLWNKLSSNDPQHDYYGWSNNYSIVQNATSGSSLAVQCYNYKSLLNSSDAEYFGWYMPTVGLLCAMIAQFDKIYNAFLYVNDVFRGTVEVDIPSDNTPLIASTLHSASKCYVFNLNVPMTFTTCNKNARYGTYPFLNVSSTGIGGN